MNIMQNNLTGTAKLCETKHMKIEARKICRDSTYLFLRNWEISKKKQGFSKEKVNAKIKA